MVLSAGFFTSCGDSSSGDSDGSGRAGSSLDSYEERADTALEAAQAAGAAKFLRADFDQHKKTIEAAKELRLAGEDKKAKAKLRLATSRLKSLATTAKKVEKLSGEIEAQKDTAEKAKAAAETGEAHANAPDDYAEAEEIYKKAIANAEEKSPESLLKAKGQFKRATAIYTDALHASKENAKDKKFAAAEKQAMVKQKKAALEKKADEVALGEWQSAEQTERRADAAFAKAEFTRANQLYAQASQGYVTAQQRVVEKHELAILDKKRQEDSKAYQKRAAAERKIELDRLDKIRAAGKGRTAVKIDGVGSISTEDLGGGIAADCFSDIDVTQYPNKLDEEDEAFLTANMNKLTPLCAGNYDPVSGKILLYYQSGRELRRSKELIFVKTKKKHVEWEEPLTKMIKDRDLDTEEKKSIFFSIGGNTVGFIVFPVPFRYNVNMTYDLEIGTMTATGNFGAVVNYNPADKTYCRTNFLNVGSGSGKKVRWKPVPGARGVKNANYWHPKWRGMRWITEFRMPDPAKAKGGPTGSSRLTTTFDVAGEDETQHGVPFGKKRVGGFVGFQWQEVKWRVRELRICGIVDKKWAVAILREKLGVPKKTVSAEDDGISKKKKKKKKKKKPRKKSKTKKDPTDEPAPTTASASKKKKKKVDPIDEF